MCAYGACLFVNVCFCARGFLCASVLGDCKIREQSVSKQNISKEYEIFYCNSSHRTQTNNNRSHHHNDWVWRIQNKRMSKVNNETKAMKWSTRNERREQTKEKHDRPTIIYIEHRIYYSTWRWWWWWYELWSVLHTKTSFFFLFRIKCVCVCVSIIAWKFTHFTFNRLKWVSILDVWTKQKNTNAHFTHVIIVNKFAKK